MGAANDPALLHSGAGLSERLLLHVASSIGTKSTELAYLNFPALC